MRFSVLAPKKSTKKKHSFIRFNNKYQAHRWPHTHGLAVLLQTVCLFCVLWHRRSTWNKRLSSNKLQGVKLPPVTADSNKPSKLIPLLCFYRGTRTLFQLNSLAKQKLELCMQHEYPSIHLSTQQCFHLSTHPCFHLSIIYSSIYLIYLSIHPSAIFYINWCLFQISIVLRWVSHFHR